MTDPWLVVFGVVAAAVVLVVLPEALATFFSYRRAKVVKCPETEESALVAVDALRAAASSAYGGLTLRVARCSLWPERKGCAERCVAAFEEHVEASGAKSSS